MDYTRLLDELQQSVIALNDKIDALRKLEYNNINDVASEIDMMMTRKEAANFIGRSMRQLDRLCENYIIKREIIDGSIRIRRSSLLRYKGIVPLEEKQSEFNGLITKYK